MKQVLSIFICSLSLMVVAQKTPVKKETQVTADTTFTFDLFMDVALNEMPIKGCTVKLFLDDKEVESVSKANMSKYKFSLFKNQHYTVQISKPGYMTRYLIVDTDFKKLKNLDKTSYYKHETSVSLVSEKQGKGNFYLDFPIGKIYYNPKKDMFESNVKYNAQIIKKIRDEAQRLSYQKTSTVASK